MANINVFKDRVKQLRLAHKLTMNEAAEMLNMKSSAGINTFEAGISKPLMDTLLTYCRFFAVSSDWLIGLSDIPYTEESVRSAKEFLTVARRNLDAEYIRDKIIKTYKEQNKDRSKKIPKKQSPNIEANIIFLENATIINDILHSRRDEIEGTAINFKPKSLREQMKIRRNERYIQYLEYHLHGITEPYFTIDGAKEEE